MRKNYFLLCLAYSFFLPFYVFAQSEEIPWDSLYNKGLDAFYERKISTSVEIYEYAKALFEEKQQTKTSQYGLCCYQLGYLYEYQGKYTEAEGIYLKSLEIRKEVLGIEHIDYSQSCNGLAVFYYNRGRYDDAEVFLIEAKNIRAKNPGKNTLQYAQSCNNLAQLYTEKGFYYKAEALQMESKNIYHSFYKQAIKDSVKTEESYKAIKDYAKACNNLGYLYHKQSLYSKAEPLYLEARDIRRLLLGETHIDCADSYTNLATLYNMQGLYKKSEPYYFLARKIYKELLEGNELRYAMSCNNLGEFFRIQKKYNEAQLYFSEAIEVHKKIYNQPTVNYAIFLHNLAAVYKEQKQYEKSIDEYKKALDIIKNLIGTANDTYARFLNSIGGLYALQGNTTQAESIYLEAKKIIEKNLGIKIKTYTDICINLANLYLKSYLLDKVAPYIQIVVENNLTQIETSLSTFSENERKTFLDNLKELFDKYSLFAQLYAQQDASILSKLMSLSLVTKGLIFQSSEKIQNQILASSDESLNKMYNEWKDKKRYLGKLIEMLPETKEKQAITPEKERLLAEEINELERKLSRSSLAFNNINDTKFIKSLSWKDLQKQLKPKEAIIEIIRTRHYAEFATDSVLYIALIIKPDTPKHPEMVVLENGKDLETVYLKHYKDAIKGQNNDKQSYTRYWEKIAQKLEGIEKIYLTPDGVYHQLNLLTLENTNTGQYLQDEIDLRILGNSKDFLKIKDTHPPLNDAVLLGFPTYNTDEIKKDSLEFLVAQVSPILALNFARGDSTLRFLDGEEITPLPGTKTEIEKIARTLKKAKVKAITYTGITASETNLSEVESPSILHIATHGFFLADITQEDDGKELLIGIEKSRVLENPLLRSGLLLTYAQRAIKEGGEGILTAYEAMNLNLNKTELVVLSACETGLGEVHNGEGVYGLQRAFQQAGAKSVLMSLWAVSDKATQKMMSTFYENWLLKKQGKREAFKNAQNTMREEYKYPYYWGAFVMVGD